MHALVRGRPFAAAALAGVLAILGVAFVATNLPSRPGQPPEDLPLQTGGTAFWLQDSSRVFDDQALDQIADHAGIVILQTDVAARPGGYGFRTVVERLKRRRPGLPVLAYLYSSEYAKRSVWNDREMLAGFLDPGWQLAANPSFAYADVRNADYREWLAGRIEDAIERYRVDGVMLDESFRSPRRLPTARRGDPALIAGYSAAMDRLFATLRERVGQRQIFFNGLWANQAAAASVTDQEKLLVDATGAAIEHFGCTPFLRSCRWNRDVAPYLAAVGRHPDKTMLVFGRSPYGYRSYRQDYRHQRATYAAYLLMSGPRTMFKYNATFLAANGLSEGVDHRTYAARSGGLDVYRDWQIPLGQPRGRFGSRHGVLVREFEAGIAAVNPPGGPTRMLRLRRPVFTPEGRRLAGHLRMAPGDVLIATSTPPAPPSPARLDFERPPPPDVVTLGALLVREAGNGFLRLRRLPPHYEHLHDVLLDRVRTFEPPQELRLRVRTRDPNAALLLAAEVDDPARRVPQVTIRVGHPSAGGPASRRALIYRSPAIRTARPETRAGSLVPDGRWREVRLSRSDLRGYRLRRWAFVRPLGDIDLDDARLVPDPGSRR